MKTAVQQLLLGLLMLTLFACKSTMSRKTNVLTQKTAAKPGATKQTAEPQNPTAKTGNNATDHTPFKTKYPGIDASTLVYRSPEYFLYKADSLQMASARTTYFKTLDTIIAQLSVTPDNKFNPAVNTDQWYAAIDFNIRRPNYVILHHTAQDNAAQTLFTFSVPRPGRESSAHYVIAKDGSVFQMLNDYVRSWHAGASKWGSITDMNSCSLGIEIDNNGKDEAFTDAQINALLILLRYLKEQYKIPQANFIGHSDIAPGRKDDPGKLFPWKKLADAGFGYWYNANALKEPPADFNTTWALRIIGYDVSDMKIAIGAFNLHYLQKSNTDSLTDYDKKVLYNVALKYM
ncbi:N-acetylmuramoyl-L-alanine amidase [Niabella hibiscisoli]|uniref:N-acetylmuramoyl-L-alanine amidase n=1 Tax=Niabella hibiscisoli TaxID=1825928 RepID=UPI001F0F280D|nr:N-acetylmuramoyl-L-alanine amidase [Niabella hibiscisoli]MCH5715729.1 N-acetylmuramoyl-L-alanine amidase [Niabella hibiscisoli]